MLVVNLMITQSHIKLLHWGNELTEKDFLMT